jgi:hypothetical protein
MMDIVTRLRAIRAQTAARRINVNGKACDIALKIADIACLAPSSGNTPKQILTDQEDFRRRQQYRATNLETAETELLETKRLRHDPVPPMSPGRRLWRGPAISGDRSDHFIRSWTGSGPRSS